MTASQSPGQAETAPDVARVVFGQHFDDAVRFAELLATEGVTRGAVGPREAGRIWTRHLLNCAVVADVIPAGVRVLDVGSGAGLPGIALALARPDLRVDLLEPLQRRVDLLELMVSALALGDRVRIVRGRAGDPTLESGVTDAPIVTARAVAPLDRLVGWCLPLLAPGGHLLALKGESAADELARYRAALSRAGAGRIDLVECGVPLLDTPTRVVRVTRPSDRTRGQA